jgi:predicted dehydrogenase
MRAYRSAFAIVLTLCTCLTLRGQEQPTKTIRAGMIGLDTSHVPAFTKVFNSDKATGELAGIKIVAGYPGGTELEASRTRVDRFTEDVRKMGVEIVDSIPKLLEQVDVVMLESVDGRIHLMEAEQVIKAGKPLWIDKPVAGSLADAIVIYELAKKYKVPVFSSSSLRFGERTQKMLKNEEVGDILGASTWGSCSYSEGTPDMFFYGIHGIEPLFTLMGTGCETVSRVHTRGTDFVTGVWKDGRVGTYRGIRRGATSPGAMVYGSKAVMQTERRSGGSDNEELCKEIGRFFKSGKSPVSA